MDVHNLIESFCVAKVAFALHRIGLLDALDSWTPVNDLAISANVEPKILRPLLCLLSLRTDLIEVDDQDRFRRNPLYRDYLRCGFHFDRVFEGFGPVLDRIEIVLREPSEGGRWMNHEAHAKAWARIDPPPHPVLTAIVEDLNLRRIVDLGCATGAFLVAISIRHQDFYGWGVDSDPMMCHQAQSRALRAGVEDRIRFIEAEASAVGDALAPQAIQQIEAVFCSNILNAFFGNGPVGVVRLLENLRQVFPGRFLIVADYYGRLLHLKDEKLECPRTLVQDVLQVVTGQGIPPPDRESWAEVYDIARCEPVHAWEGRSGGVEWFVHMLRL